MATRVSELKREDGRGAYADLDDRLLVLDFQAGNEADAFGEIHRRYAGLARHVCQNILRNPDDAEEATQEAMLRVFQGLQRFNGRYMVQPWVARIATNVSLDAVRSRQRRPVSDRAFDDLPEVMEPADVGPEGELERRLERERVGRTLAELPEHHRRALVLREFEGYSHQEIGEALGVTPPQAKALIHRAKKSFRRVWSGNGAGGRGLAALAPLLLFPARIPGALKRLVLPVRDVAGVAATTPAAVSAGPSVAERATAAAVAVLLTGSAALGAVSLRRSEHPRTPASPSVASPSAPVVGVPEPPARAVPDHRHHHRRPEHQRTRANAPSRPPAVRDDSTAPVADPSADPTPDPGGAPSSDPVPTLGPPPAFSLGFASDLSSNSTCSCGADPGISTDVQGSVDTGLAFTIAYDGAAQDAEGDAAWAAHLDVKGSATGGTDPATGRIDFGFSLDTPAGRHDYSGFGTLQSVTTSDTGTRYLYLGPYLQDDGPQGDDSAPRTGVLYLEILVWGDGSSLYTVNVALDET